MTSPFPGMDPYLEEPGGWLDGHNTFIPFLRDEIHGSLPRGYVARVTERVLVEAPEDRTRGGYPDLALVRRKRRPRPSRARGMAPDEAILVQVASVEFVETGLEIRDRHGLRVVTAIELMSHSNKTAGSPGRRQYLAKQAEVLASDVHLVEIDLLRAGSWTVACPEGVAQAAGEFDYLVSISRSSSRRQFSIYPIPLDRRLPRIAIPLAGDDPDVVADLQRTLDRCYESGRYGDTVDYSAAPVPPLPPRWRKWARAQLPRRR